jgi:glycosyltransferase involved in cell wall biosynthesis
MLRVETQLIKQDLKDFNIEIIEVKGNFFLLSYGYKIFEILFRKKIDIIHSQGTSSGIITSFINMLFRIPHVITFHETFDEKTLKGHFKTIKKKIISFLLSRADYLNTVGHDAKQNLLAYFSSLNKDLNKIVIINNGIDTAYFSKELGNQKSIYNLAGINRDSFVVGFLGRFMPEKGFPVLIDAINMMDKSGSMNRNIRVLALGGGAYIREYQQYIREKGIDDYFVFIEFQPDIRWVLQQINLLVIPSFREAGCLLSMEALVSGTIIVASDCIGLREGLKDTPARLIKSGDYKDLAEQINSIMLNYNEIKHKFNDFIPEAEQRFNVRASARRLEKLFEDVQK